MKRAVVLVMVLACIVTGIFISPLTALAENNAGNHFVKGKIIAVESCYSAASKMGSTCIGIVESNGSKHSGKIMGDVLMDRAVYLECRTENGFTNCNSEWNTSVGETYLVGGEIIQ